MIKQNQRFLNFINILLDAILIFASILIAFSVRFEVMDDGFVTVPLESYLIAALLDIPVQLSIFASFQMYVPQRKKRIHVELGRMVLGTSICMALMFAALYISKSEHFSRLALMVFFAVENVLLGTKRVILRLTLRRMRRSGYNQKHVLIVGSNMMARRCAREIRHSQELGYQIHGYISSQADWEEYPYLGNLDSLKHILEKEDIDEIFVSLSSEEQEQLVRIITLCESNGVRFSFIPYYAQFMNAATQMDSLNGIPVLSLRKLPLDYVWNAFLKRTMDIFGSLFLIVMTSPFMLAIAIGVKLSSPGPILFCQERIGYAKKPFKMFKFRSMRVNAEQNTGWTTDNDPRKTKFGSFIRKYSLDELPQFFNVLIGDMSLVGPRPEIPYFVAQFKEEIPKYLTRQQVRPGITGWAQVNGLRGDTSIEERVRYDLWYIQNWSLILDISILLRTLFGGFMNSEKLAGSEEEEEKEVAEV